MISSYEMIGYEPLKYLISQSGVQSVASVANVLPKIHFEVEKKDITNTDACSSICVVTGDTSTALFKKIIEEAKYVIIYIDICNSKSNQDILNFLFCRNFMDINCAHDFLQFNTRSEVFVCSPIFKNIIEDLRNKGGDFYPILKNRDILFDDKIKGHLNKHHVISHVYRSAANSTGGIEGHLCVSLQKKYTRRKIEKQKHEILKDVYYEI